jgi:cytochrome c-type biogenesis protein CcmH/NrfG
LARDTGRLDDAVALLRRSIAAHATDEGHLTLAFVLHEMGRLEEALASYQEGLRLNPKVVAAQGNLADLLNHFGRSQEAASISRSTPSPITARPRHAKLSGWAFR